VVLLIDEIEKADLEFPNDLLNELDEISFYIYEIGERIKAIQRPIVIITSNNEKELPDAFLRRCVFHYIEFPDPELMEEGNTSIAADLAGMSKSDFLELLVELGITRCVF
jgi:MoxR-like ATPase